MVSPSLRYRIGGLRAALLRRGRTPGLRTAKTTLAAVLAYVVADAIGTSPAPVLAPLTALLVVQVTFYRTVAQSVQRIVSVLSGVLVAVAVAGLVGLTWYSLAAVIAFSLVLGRALRLGPHLLEVPISAMLVLAVGGAEDAAAGRFYETLVGAAVGVLVSLVIVPPLYLQPAGDAIGELADRMARLLREQAGTLRGDWSRAAADRSLAAARALGAEIDRADRKLVQAEESARLNPRAAAARQVQPRLRTAHTGLEHCWVSIRELCRALLDRTYFLPEQEQGSAFSPEVRVTLADVLETTAEALDEVGDLVPSSAAPTTADAGHLNALLAELTATRSHLARLLLVDPASDEATWSHHGALLAGVDRLRVEIEATVRPSDRLWRPPPLVRRPPRRRDADM